MLFCFQIIRGSPEDDFHGNDQFPVLLKSSVCYQHDCVQRELHNADWSKFQSLCEEQLHVSSCIIEDDPTADFTTISHNIADKSIPKPRQLLSV